MTTSIPLDQMARQNAYLKLRNAQLESDVTALSAEAERLRQIVERLHGRTVTPLPTLSGAGRSS